MDHLAIEVDRIKVEVPGRGPFDHGTVQPLLGRINAGPVGDQGAGTLLLAGYEGGCLARSEDGERHGEVYHFLRRRQGWSLGDVPGRPDVADFGPLGLDGASPAFVDDDPATEMILFPLAT